jgi:hypothetical protein
MLTILEYAKLNPGTVLRDGVITQFAEQSDLIRMLPFMQIQGNAYAYNRESTLPGIAWRGINESYTESTGAINPQAETLKIIGGDADTDVQLVKQFGEGRRAVDVSMKVKAAAHSFAEAFIEGDNATNPRQIDGLRARLVGSQLIANGSTNGGDPLSLAKLDEAIDAVDSPSAIFLSKNLRRKFTVAARNSAVGGDINWSKDEFGRRVMMYNDLPLVCPFESNQGTDFMGYDELGSTGGTATATSLYVVSLGAEGLFGIQNAPIEVRDLGEVDDAPVMRTRIEWAPGIVLASAYGAARLYGISNAAIVA